LTKAWIGTKVRDTPTDYSTFNPELTTYLHGELPELSPLLVSEDVANLALIKTGQFMKRVLRGLNSYMNHDFSEGGGFSRTSRTVSLGEFENRPVTASIYLRESHMYRHRLSRGGHIRTTHTMLPRARTAILGIGATIDVGQDPYIQADTSAIDEGTDNLPGLTDLHNVSAGSILIDYHRILFAGSVTKAVHLKSTHKRMDERIATRVANA
jgi:hypothetical protein